MITNFFNSTVEVKQTTRTIAETGAVKQAFSTRIAVLPCRLTRRVINEMDQFGRTVTRAIWRLYCLADSDGLSIANTDRVVMTSSGRTLQVKTIYNPGELSKHLEIDCLEVE